MQTQPRSPVSLPSRRRSLQRVDFHDRDREPPSASHFKPTFSKLVPAGAVPCTSKGKPTVRFTGADGKPVVARQTAIGTRCIQPVAKWYGKFIDHTGATRKVPLSTNREAAKLLLADLVRGVERVRAGLDDAHASGRWRGCSTPSAATWPTRATGRSTRTPPAGD